MNNNLESIHFAVGQDQGLFRRVQDIGHSLNREGFNWPMQLLNISNSDIKHIAVAPNHVAFLLQDGRIARTVLSVNENSPELCGTRPGDAKGSKSFVTSSLTDRAAPGSGGGASGGATRQKLIRRSYQMMRAGGRAGRGVIVGTRPILPASAIPEDLIAQAQVVLQGKSRETIVRELQRTGLDVNQAVNNLLSRDEEDDDGSDSYLPEELISLLHEHGAAGEHASIMLGNEADAALYAGSEAFLDYAVSHRRRVLERERSQEGGTKPDNKSPGPSTKTDKPSPAVAGSHMQMWTDENGVEYKFDCMVAMYSELVAVERTTGVMYSWPWGEAPPFVPSALHPKLSSLGLDKSLDPEKPIRVVKLQSSLTRCTVLTEGGQVASFVDLALGVNVAQIYDTALTDLPDKPTHIYTSNLFSAARSAQSNTLYWWGVVPFRQRKKLWEKAKSKLRKQVTFDTNEVTVGCEVRMKANPVYHAGAQAFTMINGAPQVGILMESAWTLTETCRFRLQNEMELKKQIYKDTTTEILSETITEPVETPVRSVSLLPQSRKRSAPLEEPSECGVKEEAWNLREVTFIDHGKPHDNGKVVKVDGAYCGVVFPGPGGNMPGDVDSVMQTLRLMRKDELHVVSNQNVARSPQSVQKTPKPLNMPVNGNLIDLVIDSHGVRALVSRTNKLCLVRCNLLGKVDSDHTLPVNLQAFNGLNIQQPTIQNYGDDHALTVLDGNGCLMPMVRDGTNTFRTPLCLLLPPIKALSIGAHPLPAGSGVSSKLNRILVHVMTVKFTQLMQHIVHCDLASVKLFITKLEEEKNMDKAHCEILCARIDGNRTIIHAIVAACLAPSNKLNADSTVETLDTSEATNTRSVYETRWQELLTGRSPRSIGAFSVRSLMQLTGINVTGRSNSDPPIVAPVAQETQPSQSPQQNRPEETRGEEPIGNIPLPPMPHSMRCLSEPRERQKAALLILNYLCEHPFMTSYLIELLSVRDITGQTPFMYAVSSRSYSAALSIWEAAKRLSSASLGNCLIRMTFPEGSNPDDSPLAVLCYNDTCSFTWTGSEHINQDIFECRTCGLVGSLCCCTECAYVCHKNHDCKLKKTSPTAYCDCWEKCKCQALVAGNQGVRFDLFNRLLNSTKLVHTTNHKREHLLLFLARTVGRQLVEQRQCRPGRAKTAKPAHVPGEADIGVPEHDLDPPKFAKKAMETLLSNWSAVKSLINYSVSSAQHKEDMVLDADHFFLLGQNTVSSLDRFTTCLVGRCAQDMLDTLLTTLISEVVKSEGDPEAKDVVRRFVRSVIRVFLTISICSSGQTRRKSSNQAGLKCRRALQALITYSLPELASAADAIFAPVRMGLAKPTQPFNLLPTSYDVVDIVEKLFAGDAVMRSNSSSMSSSSSSNAVRSSTSNALSSRDVLPPPPPRPTDSTSSNNNNIIAQGTSDNESDSDSDDAYSNSGIPGGRASVPQSASANPGQADITSAVDDANRTLDTFEEASGEAETPGEVYYSDGESGDSGSHVDNEDNIDNEEEHENGNDVDMLEHDDDDESDDNATREFSGSDSGSDRGKHDNNIDDHNTDPQVPQPQANSTTEHSSRTSGTVASTTSSNNTVTNPPVDETRATQENLTSPQSNRTPAVVTWGGPESTARPATNPGALVSGSPATVPAPERGGGFIFLDTSVPPPTSNVRRGPPPVPSQGIPPGFGSHTMETVMPPAHSNQTKSTGDSGESASQMSTATMLARSLTTLVKQIVDLLSMLYTYRNKAPSLAKVLVLGPNDAQHIQSEVECRMGATWSWLMTVLDTLEAQLKFSSSLGTILDPKFSLSNIASQSSRHRSNTTASSSRVSAGASSNSSRVSRHVLDMLAAPSLYALGLDSRKARYMFLSGEAGESSVQVAARKDFVTYLHSLLRSQSGEHGDHFPVVDMGGLRHVVIVGDAMLSLVDVCSRIGHNKITQGEDWSQDSLVAKWDTQPESSDNKMDTTVNSDQPAINNFYKRSKSLLYPGMIVEESALLNCVSDTLPLADRPQLLTIDASKEKLFGQHAKPMPIKQHMERLRAAGHRDPTHMSLAPGSAQNDDTKASRAQSVIVHASQADSSQTNKVMRQLRAMAGLPDNDQPPQSEQPSQILMGRWKVSLTVLAKAFSDELTSEPNSVLIQLAGFPILEARFRKEMEKYRIQHSKDLVLEVDRERPLLIQQTVKQLNQAFSRRQTSSNGPPLSVHKVKITFKDEPGEGSGVARSFYAAIAEAFLANDKMPNLDQCQVGEQTTTVCPTSRIQPQTDLLNRLKSRERYREVRRRSAPGSRRNQLSVDAPPFFLRDETQQASTGGAGVGAVLNWDPSKQSLGERIYPKVRSLRPSMASKITGMLLELPAQHLVVLLTHEETLRAQVEEAYEMIINSQANPQAQHANNEPNNDPYNVDPRNMSPSKAKKSISAPAQVKDVVLDPEQIDDSAPLFVTPGKTGFYAPFPGKLTDSRLNAFRNVGRMIGLCLLQGEILPLSLCRHVFKFILGRPINWFDLAFVDTTLFQSLRSLAKGDNVDFADLSLNFSIDMLNEDGVGVKTVELKPGGAEIGVTQENILEYIYRYVEYRLKRSIVKPMQAMRCGVLDVVPQHYLEGLTGEDMRLLLCGAEQISDKVLKALTTFSDESSASPEQITRFKKWFWAVVDKMTSNEKQELVYFWTGSPALPASEEGLQPLPTVLLRPADDHHLPTANTCISRLYVPLYSSKHILKHKLITAIKAKNFGFV